MTGESLRYGGQPVSIESGDTVITSLLRAGMHPGGGGTICMGGDCPNCLCTVDGVSYIRACQTPAAADMTVEPHPSDAEPPLPPWSTDGDNAGAITVDYRTCDVVVVGGGRSGMAQAELERADGQSVEVYDIDGGHEVVGVYPGPVVVVRTSAGMIHTRYTKLVVATGAAEIQPVVPGSELIGLYTPRAAESLARAGVAIGDRVVRVGDGPETLGPPVRFEADEIGDRLAAVVTRTDSGELRTPCDAAIVDLGLNPRDGLARMAGPEQPGGEPIADIIVVGDAADTATIPACPPDGVVCPCTGVTVDQLADCHDRGFSHMELLKRSTLAGTGPCQGGVCLPYLRGFLRDRGHEVPVPFTARPLIRQLTMDEMAAGHHLPTSPRTALDNVHRDLGAHMDRVGGWWRPWNYGDTDAEYWAVRERVSLGDVSTLGKMVIGGPDAEAALQRLYPTDVSTIKVGRSRYALLLDERGYVLDDGMICREGDGTFALTFTSGGASMAEMWIRDWCATWGFDVRLFNQTFALGAINVTGPRATELLVAAGVDADLLPRFLGHGPLNIAGIDCKAYRLSFTGEASYELHHRADRSEELWAALMTAGADLGVAPHGLEALQRLRLEKGHILVGQDTTDGATPRRIQHQWAVNLDKGDFIGRGAVIRTDRLPLDRLLVGIETDEAAPTEGSVLWDGDDYAGLTTSATWSPILNKGVALAWLDAVGGRFADTVTVDGLQGRIVSPAFYDPDGGRARG